MKLLLLQPNLRFARIVENSLLKNKDTVDVAQTTGVVLNFLATKDYHGIILDSVVGKNDISAILEKIKIIKETLPVILLVNEENKSIYIEEFGSNIDSYIDTSIDEDGFLSTIRFITRREKKIQSDNVVCGNVTLNRSCYKISTSYGSTSVSQKEFLLLEILFENQGKYIPTEKLKSKIWEASPKSESNVVWTYFSYIRKKLVSIQANIEIKSTRFLGYTLITK